MSLSGKLREPWAGLLIQGRRTWLPGRHQVGAGPVPRYRLLRRRRGTGPTGRRNEDLRSLAIQHLDRRADSAIACHERFAVVVEHTASTATEATSLPSTTSTTSRSLQLITPNTGCNDLPN